MQKLFRNLTKFIALVMTIGLLILNLRLYHPGGAAYAQPRLGTDVVPPTPLSKFNFTDRRG